LSDWQWPRHLAPMLFSKVGLVLKNWSPASVLSLGRVLVLIPLGLIHSLHGFVPGFPRRRIGCTGRISDGRECILFLSLNHVENCSNSETKKNQVFFWLFQKKSSTGSGLQLFSSVYSLTLVLLITWFHDQLLSKVYTWLEFDSGDVMKFGQNAQFKSIAGIPLSTPLARTKVFV